MTLAPGMHELGPERGSLLVRTFREGVGAKVGHDLVLELTHWEATIAIAGEPERSTVTLAADSRSLEVREGHGGIKPLTDRDRGEILKVIDEKVLRGQQIEFRSTEVRMPDGDGPIGIEGELTIAGSTHPLSLQLDVGADGHVSETVALAQSAWGIKPYRGLMGALKVRDEVEVVLDARLSGG